MATRSMVKAKGRKKAAVNGGVRTLKRASAPKSATAARGGRKMGVLAGAKRKSAAGSRSTARSAAR